MQNAAKTFTSAPTTIGSAKQKAKYRDPRDGKPIGSNIMWDKRIVRGNTYATQVLPLSSQAELAQVERDAAKQKSKVDRERKKQREEDAKRSTTPEPTDGRKHIEIQTEQYLEELKDKVEENTVDTQTDPMMDRPPTPLFVPFKTGRDTETQIEEGDLLDFDFEVEPMLEVLVGKTLEQAMLEVMQEEELEDLRQQQLKYAQKRKEEELERQRLEAAEKRRHEEKQRRVKQEMERIKREKQTKEKLASRMYAQQFLGNLESRVFAQLEDSGWFHDVVEREVETQFMPWLVEAVSEELDKKRQIHALAVQLFKDVEKLREQA